MLVHFLLIFFFFFNDTATTEIYTLSLHDALPIFAMGGREPASAEDHGLVAVEDDAVLAVPLDGAGQHLALGVAAAGREVLHGVGVVGAGHVLLDDRDRKSVV